MRDGVNSSQGREMYIPTHIKKYILGPVRQETLTDTTQDENRRERKQKRERDGNCGNLWDENGMGTGRRHARNVGNRSRNGKNRTGTEEEQKQTRNGNLQLGNFCLTRHRLGGVGSDPPPLGFSGITYSFITVSTWNLAHLSGHQFGVVSCKENQNRPEFFCYRSNFVTSLHAILGR